MRRTPRTVAVVAVLVALAPSFAAAQPPLAFPDRQSATLPRVPATYDALLAESNLMIPMRDGVRLATDIYRPARNGVAVTERLPVLLIRTPYDKVPQRVLAEYFAQRGYVVAMQDIRGRYKSEGTFAKVQPADATDGYDAVEWLAQQPYANGRVGHVGNVVRRAHAGRRRAAPSAEPRRAASSTWAACRTRGTTACATAAPTRWGGSSRGRGSSCAADAPNARGPPLARRRRRWRTGTTCSRCGAG